jgi:hypothetical protein
VARRSAHAANPASSSNPMMSATAIAVTLGGGGPKKLTR